MIHIDPQLVPAIAAPVGLLLLDCILGTALAVANKAFSIQKLPAAFEGQIASTVVGVGGLSVVQGLVSGGIQNISTGAVIAAAAVIGVRALADIRVKVGLLLAKVGI